MERIRTVWDRFVSDVRAYWRAFLAVAVVVAALQLIFHDVCPVKIILDKPCPGCGLTHGCIYVLTLRWGRAWQANPASFVWVPAIAFWLLSRYLTGRESRVANGAIVAAALVTLVRYAIIFPQIVAL